MARLNRICSITTVESTTMRTYSPFYMDIFTQISRMNTATVADAPGRALRVTSGSATNDRWSAAAWTFDSPSPWGSPVGLPSTLNELLQNRDALYWSGVYNPPGPTTRALTPNYSELHAETDPHFVVMNAAGDVMGVMDIAKDDNGRAHVYAVYPSSGTTVLGYVAVFDPTGPNTVINPGFGTYDLSSSGPDNGGIRLGFSSNVVNTPVESDVDRKVWADIEEQGSRVGLIDITVDNVTVPQTEQVANFRVRYSPILDVGTKITDDLGREWDIISSATDRDRRFIDFEATRKIG